MDKLNRSDNKSAAAALQNQGIKFVKPNEEELKRWKALSAKSIEEMISAGRVSQTMFEEVSRHLNEFRNRQ